MRVVGASSALLPGGCSFLGYTEFCLPPLLGAEAEQIVERQQRFLLHVYRFGSLGGRCGSRRFHRVEKRPGEALPRFRFRCSAHVLHGCIRHAEIFGFWRVLLPQAILPLLRPGPEVGQILPGRFSGGCGGRIR